MSRALAAAIARQTAATAAKPINAAELLLEQRSHAYAFERGRPRAEAILAFCDDHPELVGDARPLVEALRSALRERRLFGSIVLSIWGSIPETCDVEPAAEGKG